MRVDHSPESMTTGAFCRLRTSVVVPRPTAWVSTLAPDGGTANLAPHSFLTVACTDPPVEQFTSVGRKDSLRKAEETGEFVVNFAPEPLFAQINATATASRATGASSTPWGSSGSPRCGYGRRG